MMRFYSGTANELYPHLVKDCLSDGAPVSVRGTETLELHPVTIELHPSSPLVTSHGRAINVAFALAEVLWILQGRKDVRMLAFYNESIRQFSDNEESFNAPYGYRLRRAHGYDQLADVLATLRDDPASRQATLSMWHPNDSGFYHYIDNPDDPPELTRRQTLDRACLSGDTTLWSPEGDLPISEVADKFKRGKVQRWPVYSVDPDTL